ncbi:AAA-ATPase At3g50940-like [Silene latifolia]|uniref:AAA-ATPase At3g50940-like n=1 Tax=Silene latifolia TaxID=37657 RepID=UPI003D77017C
MMSSFSAASLFTVYTTLTAIVSLFQQFYNQFIPQQVRNYIFAKIEQLFNKPSPKESFTLVVNRYVDDMGYNNILYQACELYISNKLRMSATRLNAGYTNVNEPISYRITQGEEYVETLEMDGIKILWKLVCRNHKGEEDNYTVGELSFELCFDIAYKNHVLDFHLPCVVVKYYEEKMELQKDIYLYTLEGQGNGWKSVEFKHPFTFDALALDPDLKKGIISDLDKFIKRKEFYNRVGRAWKRGYLLYGPPGTGKSSLVAAMANYLRFDIYDLQLGGVHDDATLRKLMLSTQNKSIVVIEDIDCALGLSRQYSSWDYDGFDNDDFDQHEHENRSIIRANDTVEANSKELSLSGLLNFIDGLWSSCGDERIIIFTTNQKERLDPALLRPGRMDMHIHMSYLTMGGFRILVNNYLGVTGEHALFKEIEQLLELANATPAEVAEELIRSEDADVALTNVVEMLKKRLGTSREKKKQHDNEE